LQAEGVHAQTLLALMQPNITDALDMLLDKDTLIVTPSDNLNPIISKS